MAFKKLTKTTRSFSGKCFYDKNEDVLIDSKDGETVKLSDIFTELGGEGQELIVKVSQDDAIDDIASDKEE